MERECDDDEVDGIGSTTVQEWSSVPFNTIFWPGPRSSIMKMFCLI